MESERFRAYFAGIGMCLLFGGSYIAMKIALDSINPLSVVLCRYIIGAIILHSIYCLSKKKERIKREDLVPLIVLCLLEPGLFFIFDAYGLKFTTATRASIVLSTIPVMTALLAAPIVKEKITVLKILTTLGSIFGVLIVISTKEPAEAGGKYLFGDFLIFCACIAAAFYTAFARKMSFRYSFFTITRFQSLTAVIFFLPLAAAELTLKGFGWPKMSSLFGVVYLGIAGSALGYLLLNYTISKLSAANAAIFSNLIPVVTMALSSLMLNESIIFRKVAGLTVLLASIFALSWGERKK